MKNLLLPLTILALMATSACRSQASGDVAAYPLETCLVTDNKLGSMGDPVVMVHKGQQVKFCCEPCVEEFEADPDPFLAKLRR